jgi:hypothetical protein
MSIIELSTGHAFAKGSVKAILPACVKYGMRPSIIYDEFTVTGVGFKVDVSVNAREFNYEGSMPAVDPKTEIIRREFIDKLLS